MMHAAMIPTSMLEERRRLGHDRFDEVWEGVLHMVPQPTSVHQRIEASLSEALKRIAVARGFECLWNLGLHDPKVPTQTSYRAPDVVVFARTHLSMRGVEGVAELVVEIISPNDESRDKLPFYARVGVREVWLLDPAKKTIEVFTGMTPVAPEGDRIRAPSLGLVLQIKGSTLHIQDGADMYEVDIRDTL
jgi:Uma2 family endonuclease